MGNSMVRAIVWCTLLMLASCGGTPSSGGDAGVDGGVAADGGGDQPDAAGGTGGLAFEFITAPEIPGASASVTVDELRVLLRDVRAIGDSAPGDSRTSVAELPLEWRAGEGPPALIFPAAPPGIYSSLGARLELLEVRGSVLLGGVSRPFRIEAEELSVGIEVQLDGLVVAAVRRTAVVSLALSFVTAVDWSQVEDEDGELHIEAGDPQMPALLARLSAAFSLAAVR